MSYSQGGGGSSQQDNRRVQMRQGTGEQSNRKISRELVQQNISQQYSEQRQNRSNNNSIYIEEQVDNNQVYTAYPELKQFIVGSLIQIREELIPVLYGVYLQFAKKIREKFNIKRALKFIQGNKQDFMDYGKYYQQIEIIQRINDTQFVDEFDAIFRKIQQSNMIVYLSQYSLELLMSFLLSRNMNIVREVINNKLQLQISKNPISDAASNSSNNIICSSLGGDELDSLNKSIIYTGLLKEDYELFLKIEAILKKQKSKNIINVLGDILMNLNEGITPLSKGILDRIMIPLPQMKLQNKMEFCQGFLERSIIDKESQPNIFCVNILDPKEQITCVDIQKNGNLIVFGLLDASIKVIILNKYFFKDFEKNLNKMNFYEEKNKNQMEIEQQQQQQRDIIILKGHETAITCISLLYDEQYCISGSSDTTIRLWCLRMCTCIYIYNGHLGTIWSLHFSPRGYYFVSSGSDCTARLWSTDKQQPLRIFTGHTNDVHLVKFIENSLYIITASYDKSIRLWEIHSGNCVRVLFHHQDRVVSISTSLTGKYMATATDNHTLILWDLQKTQQIHTIHHGLNSSIHYLDFSIDETYLVACAKNQIIYYLMSELKVTQPLSNIQPLNYFDVSESSLLITKFLLRNTILTVGRKFNSE